MSDEDDDHDLDMEEWFEMTDAQHDAVLDREMAAHTRWWNSLSTAEQIASSRRRAVKNCLSWRRSVSKFGVAMNGFWLEQLRLRQTRLLKIRAWRVSGVYPGDA